MICSEVVLNGKGFSENCAVLLTPCVTSTSLDLILDYCRLYKKKLNWLNCTFRPVVERQDDKRPIEDLLEFINGENGGCWKFLCRVLKTIKYI
ncbi:hypothetical protein MTR_6g053560 [Medicago truncatula]|uniref:Uncharacterized protein n=1 Tax=Medicago truncatula TaxID=3880 RepID=A0A072U9V1_MEDTR|nr:hypothetical protein MTR_6g053560 [Medicago truncatula]